jgi:hypothetical protein
VIGRPKPWIVATITVASVAWPRPAAAESGATLVAIVTSDPGASLTRRVRAELQTLGLDVIVLKPPDEGSMSRAPLERAARSVGAAAAVRLVPSGEGKVEVWVADRVTGKAVVRELDAPASGTSDAAVAVGSVELLRASLMELHSGEPPHGDVPPSETVKLAALPVSAAVPRLGLAVGAGAELGLWGLGPAVDADIGVWIRLASHFGARVVGHASLAPARATTPAGDVEVQSQLAGLMASYALPGLPRELEAEVSAGMAAAHVATTGTAAPPYVSASDAAWAAAPLAGLGLAWSFAQQLRLRADGLGALALPAIRVRTPAGTVGWWGGPALFASLSLEVLWAP